LLCSLLFVVGASIALPTPPSPATNAPTLARARNAAEMLTAVDRRVRTTDRHILSLLMQGTQRSGTFASLVEAISQTDVIVYIESVIHLPPSLSGRLLLLPRAAGQRYLRIQVSTHGVAVNDLISTIGHELRHALEVAASPDVLDQKGLERLYQQIGRASTGVHSYDTTAAEVTGRLVRAELEG
jgi:hypothetical protein